MIAANASRKRSLVVLSMRLIASLVGAIESTRSLRCVVRKVWRGLELVELLDGHHVHGAEAIDLRLAGRRSLVGASARAGPPPTAGRRASATSRRRLPRSILRRRPAQSSTGVGLASSPSRSSCATSAATSSSVACTASRQMCARCARSRFGGGARDVELAPPPRARPRARGAPRGSAPSCSSNCARSACERSSAARTSLAQRRRTCATLVVEPSLGVDDRCLRAARAAPRALTSSSAPGCDALLELARRLLEAAAPRPRAPLARSTSAACAALASAARLRLRLHRLAARRTAAAARRSAARPPRAAPLRAARSTRGPRPAARQASALLFGASAARRRSARCLRATRSASSPAPLQLQLEADDRLFLPVQLVCERGDRGLGLRDRHVERGGLLRAGARPTRAPDRRRARAAP